MAFGGRRRNGAIVASEERLWLSVEGAVRRRRVVEALRDAHAAEGRHAWHPTLHRSTDSEFCLLFEALMPVDSASWTAGDDRLPARSVHNESVRRRSRQRSPRSCRRGGSARQPAAAHHRFELQS